MTLGVLVLGLLLSTASLAAIAPADAACDAMPLGWKRPGLDVLGNMVYVAGQDGLYGYDVSDPSNPTQTIYYPYPESFGLMGSGDVVIRDNLAYVSAFYPDGDPAVSRGGPAIYRLGAANRLQRQLHHPPKHHAARARAG